MKKIFLIVLILGIGIAAAFTLLRSDKNESPGLSLLKDKFSVKNVPSVQHKKFDILKKKFDNPGQVTEACISCHTERHLEVMNSNHWNWEREEYIEGRGIVYLGKKNAINNFCIGVEGSVT